MEFGNPPLAKMKYPLVIVGSLFAAWAGYAIGASMDVGILVAVGIAVGAFIVFGFLQGALPIVNIIGLPIASFFLTSLGDWGFWLGGVSLVIFLLTQFRFVRAV